MDFGSLTDDELSQMLADHGVEVGPINVATRSTYERKLFKLKTGKNKPQQQSYEPVDDDDDYEVELRMPATSSPSGRPASTGSTPSSIPVSTTTYSPVVNQVRSRREVLDYSAIPRVEGRPPLSASRKTTQAEAHLSSTAALSKLSDDEFGYRKISSPVEVKTKEFEVERAPVTDNRGIPGWVKLMVLVVVVLLCYLIYSNMEETAKSNIPHLPDKVEV